MFTAISLGDEVCKVSVIMPPRDATDMRSSLLEAGKVDELWSVLMHVNIEEADASVPEDKAQILKLIADEYGFPDLNKEVAQCLKMWVVRSCESFVAEAIDAGTSGDGSKSLVRTCCAVGKLLRSAGNVARALEVLNKGQQLCECHGILMTIEAAQLFRELGVAQYFAGNPKEELESYEKAQHIREHTGTLQDPEAAKLLTNIGEAKRKMKDYTGAREAYERAKQIRASTETLETSDGAQLLTNIGDLKSGTGDDDGAIQAFEHAKQIHTSLGTLETPDGAMLLYSFGVARDRKGELAFALESYEAAWWIREKTGTLDQPEGLELLAKIKETPEGLSMLTRLEAM
eukprot:gnl/MRDRNA2_/MRDRNA2_35477_c0_seq1.p1 gnl/MRDRNA2_/MRDRNA2_35477_c0~~gnl/MRDRNA2_/MRDRNA2_35477_c0_seq1.p1  ORF type:complete len:360 (+),score=77.29 gnl/MRDRNA2_/MRDRNA2_35477_c0_seq1:46-1080(+)